MVPLPNLKLLAAFPVVALAAFASGYAYKSHKVAVEQASQTTAQTTTTAAVGAVDAQTVKVLQDRLKSQVAYSARLMRMIEEAKNANPATSASCRIPDGVRDALNADLAPAAR